MFSAPRPAPLLVFVGGELAGCLAAVRRRVAEWAAAAGLRTDLVEDLVLAVHEALANVADHAYASGRGKAWLALDLQGDVVVVVRDEGCWRVPPTDPGWRGRGLRMMRGLADAVDLRRGSSGTTVEMRWRLA